MNQENYTLIDCGNRKRLEQFGRYLIERPAPQAQFPPSLSPGRWAEAQARYIRKGNEGRWQIDPALPENFPIHLANLSLQLRFSPMGQLGVYPEQKDNWRWIQEQMKGSAGLRVLNGFAYTGGSTLAAAKEASPDCEICHIDASKSSVNWARENLEQMKLKEPDVRFIVEDMGKFMEREIKRGKSYQGIILDPPAFGRAPGGKTWKIKRDLPFLMELSLSLLKDSRFILLSCHDRDITKKDLQAYLSAIPEIRASKIEMLDLTIPSDEGNSLPNGIAARWSRG